GAVGEFVGDASAGSSSATVRVLFNVVLVPIRVRVGLLVDGNGGASRSHGCESDAGGAKARRGERRRYLADRWHRTRGTGLEEGCGGLHRERTGCSGRSVASGTARGVVAGSFRWSRSDRGVIEHKEINLGYAVALGEEGLVVPVIRDADGKSLAGLMRAIRDVVDRAKARRLTFDDFYGGTFTVNNTGPLGTIISSPIVPPGQAAIISSETIVKRLIVTDDDAIAIRQRMNLVIGFDHRVIDGATAARFLQTMRDWL